MSTAIRVESTGGGRQVAFCVSLIFLIKDQALLAQIGPDEGGFGEGSPILGHGEVFRFLTETVADEEDWIVGWRSFVRRSGRGSSC